ncbi:hypothetical protein ACFL4T_13390 [candidate division KSB1 bacterium]
MWPSGVFFLFPLLYIAGIGAAVIITVIGIWRGMKALESIAATMRDISNKTGLGKEN